MSPPETRPLPCGVVEERSRDEDEGSEGVRESGFEEEEPPSPEALLLSTDLDFWSVACLRMTGGSAGGGKPLAHRFRATREE